MQDDRFIAGEVYGTIGILSRPERAALKEAHPNVWHLRYSRARRREGRRIASFLSQGVCLQQDHPDGPTDEFADSDFPELAAIEDKTLSVHCMMAGSSLQAEDPYRRKGIGTRMAKTLIQWAGANGWEHIEADAFEEIPKIYELTGSTGYKFWEKLGFYIADRHPHPHLKGQDEFVQKLEEQAKAAGVSPERASERIVMRLDLV
jgi:GNAT superfamily N-acetyltransferase